MVKKQKLNRTEWVAEAARYLAIIHNMDSPNKNLLGFAEELASTYYDESEDYGDLGPIEAVDEDLSYL